MQCSAHHNVHTSQLKAVSACSISETATWCSTNMTIITMLLTTATCTGWPNSGSIFHCSHLLNSKINMHDSCWLYLSETGLIVIIYYSVRFCLSDLSIIKMESSKWLKFSAPPCITHSLILLRILASSWSLVLVSSAVVCCRVSTVVVSRACCESCDSSRCCSISTAPRSWCSTGSRASSRRRRNCSRWDSRLWTSVWHTALYWSIIYDNVIIITTYSPRTSSFTLESLIL